MMSLYQGLLYVETAIQRQSAQIFRTDDTRGIRSARSSCRLPAYMFTGYWCAESPSCNSKDKKQPHALAF